MRVFCSDVQCNPWLGGFLPTHCDGHSGQCGFIFMHSAWREATACQRFVTPSCPDSPLSVLCRALKEVQEAQARLAAAADQLQGLS